VSKRAATEVRDSIDRWSAARCPRCGYNLSATLAAGADRCPECGLELTAAILFPPGQPRTLSPHEWRGRRALITIALVLAAILLLIAVSGQQVRSFFP
jgi:hypothetical protein